MKHASASAFLVVAGGLLAVAWWLEEVAAEAHGVSLAQLHQHADAPVTAHLFAGSSIVVSLSPFVTRAGRLTVSSKAAWAVGLAVILVTFATLWYAGPIGAAGLAFLMLLIREAWIRVNRK